jgi:hypothetical protein
MYTCDGHVAPRFFLNHSINFVNAWKRRLFHLNPVYLTRGKRALESSVLDALARSAYAARKFRTPDQCIMGLDSSASASCPDLESEFFLQ